MASDESPIALGVAVISGPELNASLGLRPDTPVVVGRAADCAVRIDHPSVSRKHCELSWHDNGLHVRDLGSSNGTYIGGARISEGEVKDRDQLRVGDVVLRLTIESAGQGGKEPPTVTHVPPANRPVPLPAEPPQMAPVLSKDKRERPAAPTAFALPPPATPVALLEDVAPIAWPETPQDAKVAALAATLVAGLARTPQEGLFAIVTSPEAFELVITARLMGHRVYSFFSGREATKYATGAPCLISLENPGHYTQTWAAHVGRDAGVLLTSDAKFDELHRHLRALAVVVDQQAQEYFAAYFTPKTFHAFLATLSPAQLQAFFGPVRGWICENADKSGFVRYERRGQKLQRVPI